MATSMELGYGYKHGDMDMATGMDRPPQCAQAHVPKCWSLRHIFSISAHTFVVKMAFKTAEDLAKLLKKILNK
jgi:hypothetical protein